MKKFILKTSIFVIPFFILYALNLLLFNPKEGDLVRLGYIYNNTSPKSTINSQYHLPKRYTLLSKIDLTTKRKFEVITIGDSFSEQDSLSYINFLGNKGVSVLHIDAFISGTNPNQTLTSLLNANFFDSISTEYIVLQSVERYFNLRNEEIDIDLSIDLNSISNKIKNHTKKLPDLKVQFFSAVTVKSLLNNIQYFFVPKPTFSQTYKYNSNCDNLFLNTPNELLFYQDEIDNLNIKNDSLSIFKSIEVLENINDLAAKRGIKLIVLVSPDKYDLYYPFIMDNGDLIKPLFFSIYEQTEKKYRNIDSYQILSEKILKESDIYFYDDTHWTPKAAKIIADEIYNIIRE